MRNKNKFWIATSFEVLHLPLKSWEKTKAREKLVGGSVKGSVSWWQLEGHTKALPVPSLEAWAETPHPACDRFALREHTARLPAPVAARLSAEHCRSDGVSSPVFS